MTGTRNRKSIQYLAACILLAGMLCFAQIRGSTILILGVLLLQLLLVGVAAFGDFASGVLLFFLPWSTLMKLAPGSISFYTLCLILVCGVYVIRFRMRLNMPCVVAAIFLLGLALPAKLLSGGSLSLDFILFFFLLVLFPPVAEHEVRADRGQVLTVFFALGIVLAALSAQRLTNYGGIARYIDVDSWTNVVRRSGYYGDANFYAAHISAVLGGIMLQLLGERKPWKIVCWLGLMLVLIYCGLLSASKSFVITLCLMLVLWIIAILSMHGKAGLKAMILVGSCVSVVAAMGSGLFEEVIEVILYRFSFSTSISELTTGRTDLWMNYAREITSSPRILLIGNGYTNLKVNGRASHNTLIQMVFQFGLVGGGILLRWMRDYFSRMCKRLKPVRSDGLLVIVGIFLPWMALDMLFFDEFFLMPMYVAACFLSAREEHMTEKG